MTPAFDRGQIPKRILTGLSKDGPAPLHRIYGLCGATDGGQQFFVRQELKQLTADCKVRRDAGDLYVVTKPVAFEPEPVPEPVPEPPPETAPERDDHRPAAAETLSAPEEPPIEHETQPAREETEIMQTQTQSKTARRKPKNGHAPKTAAATGTKTDWIVAVVAETGTAKFGDLLKRAVKEGVFTEAKNLGAALCSLTARKKLKKVERGVYAMPGAKVVYDASKPAKKTAAASAKPAVVEKKASAKTKPRKAASKTGRKPSPLAALYAQVDAKIERNRKTDDEACAGIREIDGKIAVLQKKRVELVGVRDAARENVKKSRDGRKRIAELEAGVIGILKD